MPTLYFHVRDGDRLTEDRDGADLPDLDVARAKAAAAIREAASRPLRPGQNLSGRRFEIADGSGRVLATAAFRDVFGLHWAGAGVGGAPQARRRGPDADAVKPRRQVRFGRRSRPAAHIPLPLRNDPRVYPSMHLTVSREATT